MCVYVWYVCVCGCVCVCVVVRVCLCARTCVLSVLSAACCVCAVCALLFACLLCVSLQIRVSSPVERPRVLSPSYLCRAAYTEMIYFGNDYYILSRQLLEWVFARSTRPRLRAVLTAATWEVRVWFAACLRRRAFSRGSPRFVVDCLPPASYAMCKIGSVSMECPSDHADGDLLANADSQRATR